MQRQFFPNSFNIYEFTSPNFLKMSRVVFPPSRKIAEQRKDCPLFLTNFLLLFPDPAPRGQSGFSNCSCCFPSQITACPNRDKLFPHPLLTIFRYPPWKVIPKHTVNLRWALKTKVLPIPKFSFEDSLKVYCQYPSCSPENRSQVHLKCDVAITI